MPFMCVQSFLAHWFASRIGGCDGGVVDALEDVFGSLGVVGHGESMAKLQAVGAPSAVCAPGACICD